MPFPQRLLAEDEHVVLDLHPHAKRLLIPTLMVPIVVLVVSYAVFALPSGSWRPAFRWTIVGIGAMVLVRLSLWPWLRWQATRYVLTNKRVVIRSGVFGRRGRDIPLSRVTDVAFHHSLFERMVRCGTLTIESAGEHGQVVLPEVPSVELVQREVYRYADAMERQPNGAGTRRADVDDEGGR